jgi:hypothetical protein
LDFLEASALASRKSKWGFRSTPRYTHNEVIMREIEVPGNISSIISSLREYFDSSTDVWFRGQPTYDYKLTPSIFRQGKTLGCQFDESKMYEEFIRRFPEQSGSHKDVYEWLTLMQHYRIPTRLLDWTTNLLVALYFSCSQDTEEDGALFVFDPARLRDFLRNPLIEMQVSSTCISDFYNKLIFKMGDILDDEAMINDFRIVDIKKDPSIQLKFTHITKATQNYFESVKIKTELPNTVDTNGNDLPFIYQDITPAFSNIVPFNSPHLNLRIKQQHGCFTCHGGKYFEGKEFIKLMKMEEHPYLQDNLVKVRIKASDKEQVIHELKLSGIREHILFPEMEYQAKEIKEKYTNPLDV